MALILKAYTSVQRKFICKDLNNLLRTLPLITQNGYHVEVKRFPVVCSVRHFSTKDNQETPTERAEIYYGSLTNQIKYLKLFSLLTSFGGLAAQPFFYLKAMESANTEVLLAISACMAFIAITTPIVIHAVLKRYITHVYYNAKEDKYIANIFNIFVRTKELVFTPDDVRVPDVNHLFTNCIIKGNPLYLEQRFFNDPSHYIRIMGYDKPIDFKLGNSDDLEQTVSVNTEHKENIKK